MTGISSAKPDAGYESAFREAVSRIIGGSPAASKGCAVFKTPLACRGSAFTCKVWGPLKAIPPGSTRSYSEIAHDVKQPSGTRAVGRANGANQIVIVIPCHRVTGADGSLTGYGGGLWRKHWLIEHDHRMMARLGPERVDAT